MALLSRCTHLLAFFASTQVKIKVNANHQSQVASEWFNVPLETLEQTVPLIINGDIRNWRYDHACGKIIKIGRLSKCLT